MSDIGVSRPGGGDRAREAVRTLEPAYFALVMATGIVSIAMRLHGAYAISVVLLWIAAIAYALLIMLHVWRIVAFRAELGVDFTDPRRSFTFFTFVAGTNVLGTRIAADGHRRTAAALLAVGFLGWLVLDYAVPWVAALGRARRPIVAEANGTWFLWAVSTQSVAVLAATLEPVTTTGRRELALLAVFSWSVGIFLYAAAGTLIAARLLLYDVRPTDLTLPYWVSMGATAITVVAGAKIVQMVDAPVIATTHGLIAGASVVFWAFGSWLIPPLVAVGWWRHVVHRIPLRYDTTWWSVVFPLGMYGVGGHELGQVDDLPLLQTISADESWVALAVWLVAFLAMLHHLLRAVARPARPDPASALR